MQQPVSCFLMQLPFAVQVHGRARGAHAWGGLGETTAGGENNCVGAGGHACMGAWMPATRAGV